MTAPRPVSIVIVSRDRPQALMRCLTGVGQLDYPTFEVIVVACPKGCAAVSERADAAQIKLVPFDEANISAARNLGIMQAAGEVVAFIDDDAVPEPLWLTHLTDPFQSSEVAATGGYVLGRNGISFQWRARSVDVTGATVDLDMPDMRPIVLHPQDGRAIKTEGTNMAVRRDVLADLGGFDPAFRFYLDETDLNLRIACAGLATALVPLAQVHHGFAESARRGRDRTPRDLREIGASQQVFLSKHCPEAQRKPALQAFQMAQRLRLLQLMQRGPLGADDVVRLMRGLRAGMRDGASRALSPLTPLPRAAKGFLPYPGRPGARRVALAGRVWQATKLRQRAGALVKEGAIVSLFLFGPSPRFHHVSFSPDGVWEQNGGLFGRSLRNGRLLQFWHFSGRTKHEISRAKVVRGQVNDII